VPDQTLPRAKRLRRTADFGRVERQGTRAHGAFVTAIAKRGGGRIGFTVSKKVGNAVVRNAVKRKLRDIARRHKDLFAARDLILVAKPEAAGKELVALEGDVLATIAKLDAAPPPPPSRDKGAGPRDKHPRDKGPRDKGPREKAS
jgi:ribonuclease P protein component